MSGLPVAGYDAPMTSTTPAPSSRRPVALVTGGNRGIGAGIVVALARRGFDVVVADLGETEDTRARGRRRKRSGHARASWRRTSPTSRSTSASLEAAWSLDGRLDALVNNAGVSVARRGDVLEISPESFDRVLGVNLRGTFFLTQAVARRMLATPRARCIRSIVTISSANAVIASPDRAEYCCRQGGAVDDDARCWRCALQRPASRPTRCGPGIIRTDMTQVATAKYDKLIGEGLTPIARWGEPDDIGRAVATLACGDLPFVTGDAINVDGGLHIHRL